jgi:hypothetical protein
MPKRNNRRCTSRISRKFFILSLLFAFLFGRYADTEEIQDKAFFASEEADTSVHEVTEWMLKFMSSEKRG